MSIAGTDTFAQPAPDGSERRGDPLLAGVRRLTLLADGAGHEEEIFRGLARELLLAPGADEIHVHRFVAAPAEDEPVIVYLFEGDGRLSYLSPRAERPAGIGWVANTGRPVLAADASELAASLPRLAETGDATCALLVPMRVGGQVESVIVLVRRRGGAGHPGQLDRSDRPSQPGQAGFQPGQTGFQPGLAGSQSGRAGFQSGRAGSQPGQAGSQPGRAGSYTEDAIELASTLVEQAGTALALVRARAEAGTDPVTGCMNHRAMRRRLHEEIGRAMRTGGSLSCLLIDLDNFKLVNDQHGHPAGDAVLREVCHALVGEVRAFDRVARYGGDEFVVILPNADLDAATAAAGRILQRLAELPARESVPAVGASIGAAQWASPMGVDALLQACDTALLRSKREGKGRVTRASTLAR